MVSMVADSDPTRKKSITAVASRKPLSPVLLDLLGKPFFTLARSSDLDRGGFNSCVLLIAVFLNGGPKKNPNASYLDSG